MNKKQKINEIENAMKYGESDEKYYISDSCNGELREVLIGLCWKENVGGETNLSYEICSKACEAIVDFDQHMQAIGGKFDIGELEEYVENSEYASIYTSERLEYLNVNNEIDVETSYHDQISDACAAWYDDMVNHVALKLAEWVEEK